jgi:predicted transposase YdaD
MPILKVSYLNNEAQATIDTAFMDGEKKGEGKKAVEIATRMLTKGLDVATVAEVTGLGVSEITDLAHV